MFSKKNKKKGKNFWEKEKEGLFSGELKRRIWGIFLILLSILVILSFFNKAGVAGTYFMRLAKLLVGSTIFIIPLILLFGGLIFLKADYVISLKKKGGSIFWQASLAILVLIIGISGIFGGFNMQGKLGGWLGYFLNLPLLRYFGFWASELIFLTLVLIGGVIFWYFLRPSRPVRDEDQEQISEQKKIDSKPSFIKKIFAPRFKLKEIPSPTLQELKTIDKPLPSQKTETKISSKTQIFSYNSPPIDLLESDKGLPTSGDIKVNSAIIKKTLQNFGVEVQMSEVNIGPTVTQYSFKPAEGVKLSKITTLVNDLSLALASHPLRIEAPIPGRSLVGIEVPNKVRAQVRLKNLIADDNFQKSQASLLLALGRDVSGASIYSDLAKMPHLLVAGSTGTGKTIFLNSLILSLLYQPNTAFKSAGPETLRFILVDPKRVEFPVYSGLPHLLCPVIYNASQTVNALKWLIGEMERRFDVMSEARARDIATFNERSLKEGEEPLPFIVVIIDELADLMAARGRDIEGEIVRLAQMSRAVGIHLVVATQRPSVEVITGLIKANITSRVTFQVASQVDSRTIIDMSGAERLLGSGDMLYMSAETGKPRRIQGGYVSEKEVRKVINYIKEHNQKPEDQIEMEDELARNLAATSGEASGTINGSFDEDDSLFEEAKRVIIEAKKASASLLQRRLRVGYARAARLLDILEDKGIIGPAEGAKPREVYLKEENKSQEINADVSENKSQEESEEDSGWEKV